MQAFQCGYAGANGKHAGCVGQLFRTSIHRDDAGQDRAVIHRVEPDASLAAQLGGAVGTAGHRGQGRHSVRRLGGVGCAGICLLYTSDAADEL